MCKNFVFIIVVCSLFSCLTATDTIEHNTSIQNNPEHNKTDYNKTSEIYKKTFKEAEKLIAELTAIIQTKNYTKWQTYLSERYIRTMTDPKKLMEISEMPLLKENKIILASLEDYFYHVVVPSRSKAKLDEIIFLDDFHIKAIMVIKGQNVILYQLDKINNNWYISIWD